MSEGQDSFPQHFFSLISKLSSNPSMISKMNFCMLDLILLNHRTLQSPNVQLCIWSFHYEKELMKLMTYIVIWFKTLRDLSVTMSNASDQLSLNDADIIAQAKGTFSVFQQAIFLRKSSLIWWLSRKTKVSRISLNIELLSAKPCSPDFAQLRFFLRRKGVEGVMWVPTIIQSKNLAELDPLKNCVVLYEFNYICMIRVWWW